MEAVEDREVIVGVLANHDLACPSCNYNLRGLTGVHCPECNQKLVLRVGLAEPRVGTFVAGLVGIAGGLGFCTILSVYFAAFLWVRARGLTGPSMAGIIPLPIGVVLGGVLLWVWVRKRGVLTRMSKAGRAACVAGVWAASLVCPVLFTLYVR